MKEQSSSLCQREVAHDQQVGRRRVPLPATGRASGLGQNKKILGYGWIVTRGFKIGVTKWFREHSKVHDVWQRNYLDHIIRNQESYRKISYYIRNNPKSWDEDFLNRQ